MWQNSKSTSSPTCVKAFPAFFNIHLSKYMHILRHVSSAILVSPPPPPSTFDLPGKFSRNHTYTVSTTCYTYIDYGHLVWMAMIEIHKVTYIMLSVAYSMHRLGTDCWWVFDYFFHYNTYSVTIVEEIDYRRREYFYICLNGGMLEHTCIIMAGSTHSNHTVWSKQSEHRVFRCITYTVIVLVLVFLYR